jgi:rhodanese-related sulfurtransferase
MEDAKGMPVVSVVALLAVLGLAIGPSGGEAPPRPRFERLVAQARLSVRETDVDELRRRLEAREPLIVIDVREDPEWELGRLPGALHVSRGLLEREIEARVPDARSEVVVYCASGARSALAAESLARMGYERVSSLAGGYAAWTKAGLPSVRGRARP